jgi:hypothetical protein
MEVAGHETEVTYLSVKCLLKVEPSEMQFMHKKENDGHEPF